MPEMGDLLRDGTITDPFFEVLHDGEWNACIGKQGDELNYVEGYLQAAQLLVDTLLKDQLYGSRDTLAMPILYNARHGLELALKYVLRALVAVGMVPPREGGVDHDLLAYWTHLSEHPLGDRVCRERVAALKPFVDSLAKRDIDGQELRYFENREGRQSLADEAVVNLPLIQAAMIELRDILDHLMHRVRQLGEEYVTGTRTAECSRADLVEIARMIGPKSSWIEDAFLERKAAVRERFGLSNNQCARALDAIKGSRALKVIIEVETPLVHLTDDKLVEIATLWLDTHPPQAVVPSDDPAFGIIRGSDIDFDEIEREARAAWALDAAILEATSLEEFAELQTIFYVGRDWRFGEEHETMLDRTTAAHRLGDRRERVHHLLTKTNFIDRLVAGLRTVGQPSIASRIHELQEARRPTG